MDIPVDSPRLPFPAVLPKEHHGPLRSGPGKGPASVGHHRVIQKLPGQFSLADFASLLIEQGENIKYIQSQLGHSSPTVTWNVYAHLMKSTNQEAPSKLEKTIFETNGSKTVAKNKKEVTAKTITP